MDSDVLTMPGWKNWLPGAAVFSMVLMGLFFITRSTLKLPGILFFGLIANLAVSVIFWSACIGSPAIPNQSQHFILGPNAADARLWR